MCHVPRSAQRGAMDTLTAGHTPRARVQPWFPSSIPLSAQPWVGLPVWVSLLSFWFVCWSWFPHACLRAPHELALSGASGCVHSKFLSNVLHRALLLCWLSCRLSPPLTPVEWTLMSFTSETRPCVGKHQPQSVWGTQRLPDELLASCSMVIFPRSRGSGHL